MNPLLKKDRKPVRTLQLDLDDGTTIEVAIVKPSVGDRLYVVESAQKAGEIDAEHKPTGLMNGARLAARMCVALVWREGAPAFTESEIEDLVRAPYFEQLAGVVGQVFSPDYEGLKGNS